jgi:hypothetical protein
MSSINVTEDISYFAGYLRLTDEIELARELYEGSSGPTAAGGDNNAVNLSDKIAVLEDPDFGLAARVRPPGVPDSPDLPDIDTHANNLKLQTPAPEGADGDLSAVPLTPFAAGSGGGGSGFVDDEFSVSYHDGGDDIVIEIEQTNLLSDDDLTGDPSTGVTELHDIDIAETLQAMAETAQAQLPEDLALAPAGNAEELIELVESRDADIAAEAAVDSSETPVDVGEAPAESGDASGDSSDAPVDPVVDDGTYVNGVLVSADQIPQLPIEEPDEPAAQSGQGHINSGLDAELGGNTATNAALIVDSSEATTSMIVMGDHFRSKVIVQTNVFQDNDEIDVAGESDARDVTTGGNTADNIASFKTTEINVSNWGHSDNWSVEMVHGDLIDVKKLEQTNVMFDNDITVQTTTSSYYTVIAGENEQYNVTGIFDFGNRHYDLVVVIGDYHSANWIFQTNILLDDDIVKMATERDDTVSQTISTGNNQMVNDATIENIGVNVFEGLTESASQLVEGIGGHDIDPALAWNMDASANVFKVLYITGSYYDINLISQINVMSDVDTAIQYLPDNKQHDQSDNEQHGKISGRDGDSEDEKKIDGARDRDNGGDHDGEPETTSKEIVSTGGNLTHNVAKIVDVGTFANNYVGGDLYEETILIQANIIEDKNDKVTYGDTKTLVSEVIAFTESDSNEKHEHSTRVKDHGHHDDMMGNILS